MRTLVYFLTLSLPAVAKAMAGHLFLLSALASA